MKKTLLTCALFFMALLATAQPTWEQLGGVYYAYPERSGADFRVPEGFQPFYISHYGRHGSRWLTSDSRYEWVNSQFADKRNLTPLGREVAFVNCPTISATSLFVTYSHNPSLAITINLSSSFQ